VAAGSRDCDAGLAAETEYFTSLGVSPDSVFIFDGAGSDERDRATLWVPKTLTRPSTSLSAMLPVSS